MSYRDDVREIHRESRWTIWKLAPLALGVIVVMFVVGFGLKSLGLIGSTVVEREVFEQSYQRSSALKERIAVDEATLAEINTKLTNPNLDENTRFNLEAQASAARARIAAARSQQ